MGLGPRPRRPPARCGFVSVVRWVTTRDGWPSACWTVRMAKVRRSPASSRSAKKDRSRIVAAGKPLTHAAAAAGLAVSKTVAGVAARVMPAGPHDPIAMLERDHRRLEEL